MFVAIIAAVALMVLFYMYHWDPKKIDLDARQAHVDSLLVINQRAKAELAQGKTAQLREEAERLSLDLDRMRELVPTGNEVPALLEQVSTAARRVGLDIADVQPLPTLTGDQYDAYKYRMSVRGSYHQIGDFLANVGSLQRIVTPINVLLNPVVVDARARKDGRSQPIEARFELQTFVARTTDPSKSSRVPKLAPDAGKPGER
jgi:type IV pilus assembly protein PilO